MATAKKSTARKSVASKTSAHKAAAKQPVSKTEVKRAPDNAPTEPPPATAPSERALPNTTQADAPVSGPTVEPIRQGKDNGIDDPAPIVGESPAKGEVLRTERDRAAAELRTQARREEPEADQVGEPTRVGDCAVCGKSAMYSRPREDGAGSEAVCGQHLLHDKAEASKQSDKPKGAATKKAARKR